MSNPARLGLAAAVCLFQSVSAGEPAVPAVARVTGAASKTSFDRVPLAHHRPRTVAQEERFAAAEADRKLKTDWLRQAADKPLVQCAFDEIRRARRLAERIAQHADAPKLDAELAELDLLETGARQINARARRGVAPVPVGFQKTDHPLTLESLAAGSCAPAFPPADFTSQDLYLAIREIKRRIYFKHPALGLTRVFRAGQLLPQDQEAIIRALSEAAGVSAAPPCGGGDADEDRDTDATEGAVLCQFTPDDFLRSTRRSEDGAPRLYLTDSDGNLELLCEDNRPLVRH